MSNCKHLFIPVGISSVTKVTGSTKETLYLDSTGYAAVLMCTKCFGFKRVPTEEITEDE